MYLSCVCDAIQFIIVVVGVTKYPSKINYFFANRKGLAVVCAMATRNSSVGSFGAFPELVIDLDNVSGS